jgi:biopolymer transport protein ExbD
MGDGDEAVSINVTPLIDVIFCLCIFFICSFHFKQLEGKLEAWMPKDKGVNAAPAPTKIDEMRVFVRKAPSGMTELSYGGRLIGELTGSRGEDGPRFDELTEILKTQDADWRSQGRTDVPVVIDGEPGVPWKDVLEVLDRCRKSAIDHVEFAQAMPAPR